MKQADIDRLNNLCDRLEAVLRPLHFSRYMAPLNREEEKTHLLDAVQRGETYNPQFVYQTFPGFAIEPLLDLLKQLNPTTRYWDRILFDDIRETIASIHTLETHDPAQITANSIVANGLPTRELVAAAYALVSSPAPDVPDATLTAEDVALVMRRGLASAGLDDWQVTIESQMSAHMSVRSIERTVQVRDGATFAPAAARRLLVHEIGTHVFRYMNGAVQPLRLLRYGFGSYMMTEEGMATYHEFKHGLQDGRTHRRYALRVIAAHLSLTHSFYDVFTHLTDWIDMDEAFEITARAKRGFTDTAEYGAHVKDKVYFEGFDKVQTHLAEHPDDYPLLMAGKVSLDVLPALRALQADSLLIAPQYLPDQLLDGVDGS